MSIEQTILFLDKVNERELALKVADVFGKYAYSFEQFDDVSKTFFKVKDYDKAIYYGEKAYAIASTPQQMYIIRHNLINVYNHANLPEKALRYIKANEAVLEKDNDRDFEKAFSLFLLNRKSEAAAILREKVKDPNLTEEERNKVEFNLGTYDLLDGDLQQGLKRFLLAGEQMGIWDNTKTFMTQPLENYGLTKWDGNEVENLLIIAEAGIGDEVINVRFAENVKNLGINYYWLSMQSRKDLVEIYNQNGINAVCSINEIPKDFLANAKYVSSMQLPIFLNLEYKDLWNKHYLINVDKSYDEKWNEILQSVGDLKIGIRYQGNPAYDQDLHRSIPLKEIIDAVSINAELYSIQRDTGLEELQGQDIVDLSNYLVSMGDLFGCLSNLDLVITSCTSIAHIAAAMGKKVCVIVPISCYYIWCNPGKDTPWYSDNVKVFYQQKPRSWKEPLQELSNWLVETYS